MGDTSPMKRRKPTLVCTNCKKRKIKCDRQSPCSSCVKTNSPNLCYYETKWRPITFKIKGEPQLKENVFDSIQYSNRKKINKKGYKDENNNEIDLNMLPGTKDNYVNDSKLFSVIDNQYSGQNISMYPKSYLPNPIGPPEEIVNFYEGYNPIHIKDESRRVNFNPLYWASIVKKDPWSLIMWKHIDRTNAPIGMLVKSKPEKNPENIEIMGQSLKEVAEDESENKFLKRVLEIDGYDEIIPYSSLMKARSQSNTKIDNNGKLNLSSVTLRNTILEGKLDPELELIEKIKLILPKKKVLWKLIERFFEKLYPFLPFVDEGYFHENMERMFGMKGFEDEPLYKITIGKKLDLANVALCLIILRFTYLSLFSNRNRVNEEMMNSNDPKSEIQELKYLMLNPINTVSIEVAQLCLDCFQITRKTNLTVFQGYLYMRLYRKSAPEEGDGIEGGDSQVTTAILIQVALALGLNREPDKFPEVCNDERINNLGRKIWSYLVRSDVLYCFDVGNPMSIDPKHCDAKSPFLTKNNSNISDVRMEGAILESFSWLNNRMYCIRNIVEIFSDINGYHKMNGLTQSLNELENNCHEFFTLGRTSNDVSNGIERYYHVMKSRIFVTIKGSLFTVYYHIYLYYENQLNYDKMYFYYKKVYSMIRYDILPYLSDVLYGELSDDGMMMNPAIEMVIHRANHFNIGCCIRIASIVFDMIDSPDHIQKLTEDQEYRIRFKYYSALSSNLKSIGNLFLSILSRFASRYYYAWRILKAHTFIFGLISRGDCFKNTKSELMNLKKPNLTSLQLEEFTSETRAIRKHLESLVNYNDPVNKPEEDVLANESPEDTPVHVINDSGDVDISTPFSSLDFPLDGSNINNEDIDDMWLSIMAMKYDPFESSLGYGWIPNE